jgi:predicted RNA-binding protein associated with RNAse of E/G family
MKRKLASRERWHRLKRRRFEVYQFDEPRFSGVVTCLEALSVATPLWADVCGSYVCILNTGFVWLQHFPVDSRHVVTTVLDTRGHVVQWYVDICWAHGITRDGIPWYDDLYLDVVVSPTRACSLLDRNELDEALADGRVTEEQHKLALAEARAVLHAVGAEAFGLLDVTREHARRFAEPRT